MRLLRWLPCVSCRDKIVKLEDEIATGKPSERRIFQLAEMQARRDQTLHTLTQTVAAQKKELAERMFTTPFNAVQ